MVKSKGSGWRVPRIFFLYRDESTPILEVEDIAEYLRDAFRVETKVKDDFFRTYARRDAEKLAVRIAATKVRDISKPFSAEEPAYGETMFELRLLQEPTKKVPGILYDAIRLQRLILDLIPAKDRTFDVQHLVFTSRLIGTFESDGRYHAHVNVCGYPAIISTSGIVEAPAKPKEYYVLKQRFVAAGDALPFELLKERFAGQFIDYDDLRMTEVLKGYALQCAMHTISGEAFCGTRTCRMFNAHWQAEVLRAQLGGKGLCKKHTAILEEIKRR